MTTLHLNAVINTDCIKDVLHHPIQFSSLQSAASTLLCNISPARSLVKSGGENKYFY